MTADPAALIEAVAERGFLRLAPTSRTNAEHLAGTLGEVLLRTEVRLNPKVSTYLCRPNAIPPHTDHPAARFILWYCQAPGMGPNRLVDARQVLAELPRDERRAFERLRFDCPKLTDRQPSGSCTLWDEARDRIFFAAWCACGSDAEKARQAESLFAGAAGAQHTVQLDRGESLLIDNHRMLHFRDALPMGSPRWLTRWWIAGPTQPALRYPRTPAILTNPDR